MPIDENIKRNIRDLYFDQHKTIRELAKITRKSSRDIIAVIKVSGKENAEENKHQNKKKETQNMTRLQGKCLVGLGSITNCA